MIVCRNGVGKGIVICRSHKKIGKRENHGGNLCGAVSEYRSNRKRGVPTLKGKMDFGMPLERKIMGDAMKITRTSCRLTGMKPPTRGGSSSARGSAGAQGSRGAKKSEMRGVVYTPYSNVDKHSRLTSMDERRDWVDNLLPPGAKTKFEVYKGEELGGRIDHAVYEVKIFLFILIFI